MHVSSGVRPPSMDDHGKRHRRADDRTGYAETGAEQ
jgi:hypothetical protein